MDENVSVNEISAERFIDRCLEELTWKDLPNDVIMDLGCGLNGIIGKRLLVYFKEVGSIISITKDPNEAKSLSEENATKIKYEVADIEKRETLGNYEGKITKVISTHSFHYIADWELAFQNIYHLLKPGGEVAIQLVLKTTLYEWLTEMLKEPRWKAAFQGRYVEGLYKRIFDIHEIEWIKKIGFEVFGFYEQRRELPYHSDQLCKDDLFGIFGKSFNIPPQSLEEFKEQSFQALLKVNERNNEGKPCLRLMELNLLLKKPINDVSSSTNDTVS